MNIEEPLNLKVVWGLWTGFIVAYKLTRVVQIKCGGRCPHSAGTSEAIQMMGSMEQICMMAIVTKIPTYP